MENKDQNMGGRTSERGNIGSDQQSVSNTGLQENYSDEAWARLPKEQQEQYHRQFPGRRNNPEQNTSSSGSGSLSR